MAATNEASSSSSSSNNNNNSSSSSSSASSSNGDESAIDRPSFEVLSRRDPMILMICKECDCITTTARAPTPSIHLGQQPKDLKQLVRFVRDLHKVGTYPTDIYFPGDNIWALMWQVEKRAHPEIERELSLFANLMIPKVDEVEENASDADKVKIQEEKRILGCYEMNMIAQEEFRLRSDEFRNQLRPAGRPRTSNTSAAIGAHGARGANTPNSASLGHSGPVAASVGVADVASRRSNAANAANAGNSGNGANDESDEKNGNKDETQGTKQGRDEATDNYSKLMDMLVNNIECPLSKVLDTRCGGIIYGTQNILDTLHKYSSSRDDPVPLLYIMKTPELTPQERHALGSERNGHGKHVFIDDMEYVSNGIDTSKCRAFGVPFSPPFLRFVAHCVIPNVAADKQDFVTLVLDEMRRFIWFRPVSKLNQVVREFQETRKRRAPDSDPFFGVLGLEAAPRRPVPSGAGAAAAAQPTEQDVAAMEAAMLGASPRESSNVPADDPNNPNYANYANDGNEPNARPYGRYGPNGPYDPFSGNNSNYARNHGSGRMNARGGGSSRLGRNGGNRGGRGGVGPVAGMSGGLGDLDNLGPHQRRGSFGRYRRSRRDGRGGGNRAPPDAGVVRPQWYDMDGMQRPQDVIGPRRRPAPSFWGGERLPAFSFVNVSQSHNTENSQHAHNHESNQQSKSGNQISNSNVGMS